MSFSTDSKRSSSSFTGKPLRICDSSASSNFCRMPPTKDGHVSSQQLKENKENKAYLKRKRDVDFPSSRPFSGSASNTLLRPDLSQTELKSL